MLTWDKTSERLYETGVDRCVLYVQKSNGEYGDGVAWNGVTAINEKPSGAEPSPLYANNRKYLNLMSNEDFEFGIEAYTYPDEFEACDGSATIADGVTIGQQKRSTFGLCFRTLIGNDVEGTDHGYKLHFIYGALASPSEKNYETVNDSPDAITFSWDATTTPVEVTGYKPTARLIVDSTKIKAEKLRALETLIYGGESDSVKAKLPLPDEIASTIGTTIAAG